MIVAIVRVARLTEALHIGESLAISTKILRLPAIQDILSLDVGDGAFYVDEDGNIEDDELYDGLVPPSLRLHHLGMDVDGDGRQLPSVVDFVQEIIVGSGGNLVSLCLREWEGHSDAGYGIFQHLAPQLASLVLRSAGDGKDEVDWPESPLWRCTQLRSLSLESFEIGEISKLLSMVLAPLVTLDLLPSSEHRVPWLEAAFLADPTDDPTPPPFLALLELPCLRNLEKWKIGVLEEIETKTGAGAEWKTRCDAKNIELLRKPLNLYSRSEW